MREFKLNFSHDDFDSHIRPVIEILTTSDQTLANNEVQAKLIQVIIDSNLAIEKGFLVSHSREIVFWRWITFVDELKHFFIQIPNLKLGLNFLWWLFCQTFVENDPDPIAKIKTDFAVKYPSIVEDIEAVEEWKWTGANTNSLVSKFGMACPIPGSFHSSLVMSPEA